MKVLIRLLKNDFTRIFRINQMRYGNPSQRSKAISFYILIFASSASFGPYSPKSKVAK